MMKALILKVKQGSLGGLSKGVHYMIFSTFCFTVMQGFIKFMPYDHIPTVEQTFFRSAVSCFFCVLLMFQKNISFKVKHIKLLTLRSIMGTVSMFAFFYILPRMPLGSSVTLKYLSPVFTALSAVIILKEQLKPMQWFYFFMAFVGVILLKGFDSRIEILDFWIGIFSAVTSGLLYIILRKIGDDDHPYVVVFYFMFCASLFSAMFMIPFWVTPSWSDSFIFLGVGFSGFIAQIYMTKAFQQKEDANYIAIFKYLEAAFAIIIGFFCFGETYTILSFFGIILIFTSLILSIRLKSKTEIME